MLSARLFALTTFFLGAIATPVPATGPDHPPWDQVYIKSVNYAGSGCPAGSAAGTLATDGSFLHIAFDSFIASDGPGIPITENRKNCDLAFEIHFPEGWSLTIFDTRYDGYLKLDNAVTANQKSTYRWGGQTGSVTIAPPTWTGPKDLNYVITETLLTGAWIWSTCKGTTANLIINTQVKTDNTHNPKGSGFITIDSVEQKVVQIYHFHWRRC
jgi:hypothetical protein